MALRNIIAKRLSGLREAGIETPIINEISVPARIGVQRRYKITATEEYFWVSWYILLTPDNPDVTIEDRFTLPSAAYLIEVYGGADPEVYGFKSDIKIDGEIVNEYTWGSGKEKLYVGGDHTATVHVYVTNPPTGWWNLNVYPYIEFRYAGVPPGPPPPPPEVPPPEVPPPPQRFPRLRMLFPRLFDAIDKFGIRR